VAWKRRETMKRFVVVFLVLSFGVLELDAWARAGGGRSFGGGSSRSFSSPYRGFGGSGFQNPSRSYEAPRPAVAPSAPAGQAWGGGGFLRSLTGGLAGGFLGSLLFGSLGYGAGWGGLGSGSGGIGLLEILLFAGVAFALVAYLRRRNQEGLAGVHAGHFALGGGGGGSPSHRDSGTVVEEAPEAALRRGLAEVEVVVPGFDPLCFPDEARDIFFRIQSAWAARDLQWAEKLLTPEVRGELQRDLDVLKAEKRINTLENIAVRRAEIREVWVESGKAFVTVRFIANLLDYTVEEGTGRVVAGSREVPVKFEEYWTFARSASDGSWRLTAIQQTE
jgi:predicted lipid-binding transport protein (Tim44 family)